MDQVTKIKVQFRPAMKSAVGAQKGKKINTLIADDIEWTYLPATKDDAIDEDATENEGGNIGGSGGSGGDDLVG
jgi:hypothetical protein